jgi:hypothetical protein
MKDSAWLEGILWDMENSSYYSKAALTRMEEIIRRIKDVEMSIPGFPKE